MNYVDVARNISAGRGIAQSTLGFNQPYLFDEASPIPSPMTSQSPLYPISASIRVYQLTENARITQFVADCELWDILPPSQPTRTLVLACPGVNAIRFWLLPVQQPWEEGIQILVRYVGCAHIERLGLGLVKLIVDHCAPDISLFVNRQPIILQVLDYSNIGFD